MPTERHGRVRRLLRDGCAKVVKRCPFTIQLLYEIEDITQPVSLGVDAGSKTIGLSATTEEKVLYEAEVMLRTDIVKLLSVRRELRHGRRYRKTRYRQPRFNNRVRSKHKGWHAPSVEAKIATHLKVIADVCKILPITEIIVETAAFDTQLLKAKEYGKEPPKGKEYQEGEQLKFYNTREYILFRDGHKCRCCKGETKDHVLNVHHIESRETGGNAPNNLVTLCKTCHDNFHAQKIELPAGICRGNKYNDAAFMGIMRWAFYDRLKKLYPNVRMTYGYITKHVRISNGLSKGHCVDARCISGHPKAKPPEEWFFEKKVRCHNRQIHKQKITRGGKRKANQAAYLVLGYRLFDKVRFGETEAFIFGRRTKGYFDLRMLDGTTVNASVHYKKLRFLEPRKTILIERRDGAPPTTEVTGLRADAG